MSATTDVATKTPYQVTVVTQFSFDLDEPSADTDYETPFSKAYRLVGRSLRAEPEVTSLDDITIPLVRDMSIEVEQVSPTSQFPILAVFHVEATSANTAQCAGVEAAGGAMQLLRDTSNAADELAYAKSRLETAEQRLADDPTSEYRQESVEHQRKSVEVAAKALDLANQIDGGEKQQGKIIDFYVFSGNYNSPFNLHAEGLTESIPVDAVHVTIGAPTGN